MLRDLLFLFLALLSFFVGEGLVAYVTDRVLDFAIDNQWVRDHNLSIAIWFPSAFFLFGAFVLVGFGSLAILVYNWR